MEKLDILAFGAHPDDVELSCAGTLIAEIASGKTVGIIDLTRGELGTRGTVAIRDQEATDAAAILGITVRENLDLADGFFRTNEGSIKAVIRAIRKYKPNVVLANALRDRHPDHGKGAELLKEAFFLSGLRMIETEDEHGIQAPWRPSALYNYIQDRIITPDFVVDISAHIEQKMDAIKAFKSQFFDPNSKEPNTYIASETFLDGIYSRAQEMGREPGFKYAEGFTQTRVPGVKSLFNLS
jgi:bacillithiol biosynthesis deacetylase BshB1